VIIKGEGRTMQKQKRLLKIELLKNNILGKTGDVLTINKDDENIYFMKKSKCFQIKINNYWYKLYEDYAYRLVEK